MNKKTYLIEKAEKGLTIQQYLKQIAGFSNAQIRSMKFTENGICLGGQRARVTTILSEGDVLEVLLETKNSSSAHLLSFEQMPDILYEDADVIAVNKPAGMAVHPSHGHYQDTLANQLAYYFRKNTQQVEIHSIGRLDLETSGIVLFAKHRAAAARLSRQREDGRLQKTYLAIVAVNWTKYARLARSMVLKVKRNLYVEAAVVNGTSTFKILWKHILPNMLTTMTVTAAADMGTMMLELASLSFLGFGAVAPTPEWGLMLNEGRTYMAKAPWLMIAPGIAIVIVVIIFNMLGDSIRDILDPRQD